MTKIKDVDNYSLYACSIHCLLTNYNRYLFAFLPKNTVPLKSTTTLDKLSWLIFQTRTLEEDYHLHPHKYNPKRGGDYSVNIEITSKNEGPEHDPGFSVYKCDKFKMITITLLHTKKGPSNYQDKGILASALETYQTIISYI